MGGLREWVDGTLAEDRYYRIGYKRVEGRCYSKQ